MSESHAASRPRETHTLDAEIFSTGTWNDERFTVRDLHEIARNFRRLREQLRPPLKFGHDEAQTLLGQQDGDPALGWVERLWVAGDKLMARFTGVPRVVYEAVRAGRYRRVSAELYFDVRQGGRRLGKVLKAVALLGADLPAVTNLADLTAYLAAAPPTLPVGAARAFTLPVRAGRIHPHPTHAFEETNMSDATDPRTQPAPETPADADANAGDPGPPDDLQAELAELRAYRQRTEQREAEQRQRRHVEAFRAARAEALAFSEAQVRAGRLPPHLHDALQRELDGQVRAFAEGRPLRVSFAWVRRCLEATSPADGTNDGADEAPGGLPLGEVAFAASDAEPAAGDPAADNPSATLARLAANAMAELSLPYGEAAAYVMRTRPALARAYRDYTLNPSL